MSSLLASQTNGELLGIASKLPTSGESKEESKYSDNPMDERFCITTTINSTYIGRQPDINYVYDAITSDVISRYHRIYGRNVLFLTVINEDAQKVKLLQIPEISYYFLYIFIIHHIYIGRTGRK